MSWDQYQIDNPNSDLTQADYIRFGHLGGAAPASMPQPVYNAAGETSFDATMNNIWEGNNPYGASYEPNDGSHNDPTNPVPESPYADPNTPYSPNTPYVPNAPTGDAGGTTNAVGSTYSGASATGVGNIYGYTPEGYDPATMNPNLVSDNLNKLIAQDSNYMKLAETNALQGMNSRGLLNSSLAVGAGQAAAIDRALPIAQGDAQYQNASSAFNAGASNEAMQFNANAVNYALNNYASAMNADTSQAAGINSNEAIQAANRDLQRELAQATNDIANIQNQNIQDRAWAELTNNVIQTGITNGVFSATDNEQADIDRITGYLKATLSFLPDGGKSIIDQFVDDIVNDVTGEG